MYFAEKNYNYHHCDQCYEDSMMKILIAVAKGLRSQILLNFNQMRQVGQLSQISAINSVKMKEEISVCKQNMAITEPDGVHCNWKKYSTDNFGIFGFKDIFG